MLGGVDLLLKTYVLHITHRRIRETISTTKIRHSVSLLTAPAVAAGALTLSAAASQVAPTFGLAAMTERTPSLVDPDVIKTGSITTHKLVRQGDNDTREDSDLLDPDTTGIPLADATSIAEKFTPADLTKQEG